MSLDNVEQYVGCNVPKHGQLWTAGHGSRSVWGSAILPAHPTVTLVRTTAEECAQIGKEIAKKVAAATGPAAIMLPLKGVSAINAQGQAFDDPVARRALFDAIRQSHGSVEFVEMEHHINDPEFSEAAARRLLHLMRQRTEAT